MPDTTVSVMPLSTLLDSLVSTMPKCQPVPSTLSKMLLVICVSSICSPPCGNTRTLVARLAGVCALAAIEKVLPVICSLLAAWL